MANLLKLGLTSLEIVSRYGSITSKETAMKGVMDTLKERLLQSDGYGGLQVEPHRVYHLLDGSNLLEGFRLVQLVPLEKPLEIRRFFGYGPIRIREIRKHDLREIVYADLNE